MGQREICSLALMENQVCSQLLGCVDLAPFSDSYCTMQWYLYIWCMYMVYMVCGVYMVYGIYMVYIYVVYIHMVCVCICMVYVYVWCVYVYMVFIFIVFSLYLTKISPISTRC